MPHLADPNFHRTVVFMCEHSDEGAMGVVVNRPLPFFLNQIYEGQEITGLGGAGQPVNFGGPVQPEVGFLLYESEKEYEGAVPVLDKVSLGTSLEILQDIADKKGPSRFFFALGYAGWGGGQLEEEIGRNDWLVVPGDDALIFELPPDQRWEHAIRSLGIDPGLLTQTTGSA